MKRPLAYRIEDWFCLFVFVGLLVSSLGCAYCMGASHVQQPHQPQSVAQAQR